MTDRKALAIEKIKEDLHNQEELRKEQEAEAERLENSLNFIKNVIKEEGATIRSN